MIAPFPKALTPVLLSQIKSSFPPSLVKSVPPELKSSPPTPDLDGRLPYDQRVQHDDFRYYANLRSRGEARSGSSHSASAHPLIVQESLIDPRPSQFYEPLQLSSPYMSRPLQNICNRESPKRGIRNLTRFLADKARRSFRSSEKLLCHRLILKCTLEQESGPNQCGIVHLVWFFTNTLTFASILE